MLFSFFLYFVDIAPYWVKHVYIRLPLGGPRLYVLYCLLVSFRHVCIILPHSGRWSMILPLRRLLMYVWTLPLIRPYMYVFRFRLLVGLNVWFWILPLGRYLCMMNIAYQWVLHVFFLSTLGLDWNRVTKLPPSSRAFVWPPIVGQLLHARVPIWGPLSIMMVWGLHMELRVLSLSLLVEEGRSTFGVVAGIWAKF